MDKKNIYINLKTDLIQPCSSTYRTIELFTSPPTGLPLAPTMKLQGLLLGDTIDSSSNYLDSFSGKVVYPLKDREHNSILDGVTVLSHEIAHWIAQLKTPLSMYPILGGEVEDYEPHESSVAAEMHALNVEFWLNYRLNNRRFSLLDITEDALKETYFVLTDFILPYSDFYHEKFKCLTNDDWIGVIKRESQLVSCCPTEVDPIEIDQLNFDDFELFTDLDSENEWQQLFGL